MFVIIIVFSLHSIPSQSIVSIERFCEVCADSGRDVASECLVRVNNEINDVEYDINLKKILLDKISVRKRNLLYEDINIFKSYKKNFYLFIDKISKHSNEKHGMCGVCYKGDDNK